MTTSTLFFAALLAASASPVLAARCEPPVQKAETRRGPVFTCPANPQIVLSILQRETRP